MFGIFWVVLPSFMAFAGVRGQNSSITCAEGLKMFVSRGTGEDMGFGDTKALVDTIAERIEGSHSEAILYPASDGVPTYFESVANGTRLVREKMTAYAQACPNSKMSWFGYSQGAQITSNNVCGMAPIWGNDAGYDPVTELDKIIALSTPLPAEVTNNVVSIVLFGDPSQTNTTFSRGNWTNTGIGMFYRQNTTTCEALGNRIRAYCHAGDPFCDVGDYVDAPAHVQYRQNYGNEVVEYVVDMYNNWGTGDEGSETELSSPTETPGAGAAGHLAPVSTLVIGSVLVTYLLSGSVMS